MEVKPIDDGYKKTVAGVIPHDWSVRHMGEVARVVSGQVDPTIKPYSLMPLVAPDHIECGSGRLASSIPTAEEQRAISGKYVFRSGTVIYSKIRPHLRKVCIAPFDGVCSADMYPLLPADDVHPGFLFASLLSERFSKYAESVSIRSGMPKINREELADFEFVLPSTRYEQAQIALTLTDADALIDSLEQLLTKKRQIKQGAMQELLTGKRRLPGYTSPWHPRRIGSFAPLQRGFDLPARARKSGEYPVVYSNGILNFHSEFMVKGPGVVTGRSGTIGAVTFVEQSYWPHNTALWVTDFNSSDPKFVFYLLQHIGLDRFATGSGVPTLNRNDVHAFVVHVPSSVGEQAEIAQVLSDIDTELATLGSRLTKARALKQAMAQALLTGRIRLVEPTA